MNRERVMTLLTDSVPVMAHRFDVHRLALFGSAARDELRVDSDVDVLVEFKAAATFDQYIGLKFYLEDLLGRPVDLVTQKGLRKEFQPIVKRESLVVA